jgi:hypothetical protein
MQWQSKFFLKDREGETRVVRKFLFFPRRFHNDPLWQWMVWADIVEQVRKVDIGGSGEWGNYAWRWCEIGFTATMKPEDLKKPEPTRASETAQYLLDAVSEDLESGGEEALLQMDGFETALLGIATRFGGLTVAAYNRNKCIDILMTRDGMSHEDAEEFFESNVIGAWVGDRTPIFVTLPG